MLMDLNGDDGGPARNHENLSGIPKVGNDFDTHSNESELAKWATSNPTELNAKIITSQLINQV